MLFKEVRKDVAHIGAKMAEYGLVAGTWGNISARIDNTEYIAITPSGMDYFDIEAKDIVIVDLYGNSVDGARKPSSEMRLHLALYQSRADISAVVHTHSIYASACAVAGKAIPPIVEDLVQIVGGSVEVAPYALPGTDKVAENATKSLGTKFAVLLESHGVVGVGNNIKDAFKVCQLVEKSAQIYILSQLIGGAKTLDQHDVQMMHQFLKDQYGQR